MSITRSIGNAMSGLRVMSRSAELVSRNISNAQTAGYTRKTLEISQSNPGGLAGGARADGVLRAGDPALLAAKRRGDADAAALSTEAEAKRRIADSLLDPDGGDSLQNRYIAFEGALRALADTPESAALQREAAAAADGLARKLNLLSTDARRLRMEADAEIERQVRQVNRALDSIDRLNSEIASARAAGRDVSGLQDERDRQIELVNSIVPIKSTKEMNGGLQLVTEGGAILMWPSPEKLGFQAARDPSGFSGLTFAHRSFGTPDELEAAGLTIDDAFARVGAGGGSLQALFRIRDEIGRDYARELDLVAADLALAFQDPAGYVAGDPGLFVQDGAAYDPTAADQFEGLAGRIELNGAVRDRPSLLRDPTGFLTIDAAFTGDRKPFPTLLYERMSGRDGAPGPDAAVQLGPDAADTLDALGLSGRLGTRADMVTTWLARREGEAGAVERESGYRQALAQSIEEEALAASAVDTDEELRRLLVVERAYAANARVLQTADEMLGALLNAV